MTESVDIERWRGPAAILRYGLPVLAVAAATIIQHLGNVRFAVTPSFVCAVLLSAWFGGVGPGLLATALSVLAIDYYFVPPIRTFSIETVYIPALILFSAASLFVTWLSARERDAGKSLIHARDQLDLKIRELQAEIEARKRAEEELNRLRSELAHVTRVMTLGELVASIAHEINQPLTAVITDASAGSRWLDGPSSDMNEARQALARIRKNTNRAVDVIDRIRALAKKSPIQMIEVDINEVIISVIAVTRSEIERNRVALRTELDKDLPSVRGDRIQLQQVVLNLIMNAIEAMAASETRELLVCSRDLEAKNVLVSVCDSGSGLDSQKVDRLLEAFYTTKPSGMGMGLAICRSIMQTHGGRLTFRVNEPRGAIFEIELPIEKSSRGSVVAFRDMGRLLDDKEFARSGSQSS
jgi:C4-dicarboxylate-specific signal transduction histidine kinase